MRAHSSGSENCGNISSRRIRSWRAAQTCCRCLSDALELPAASAEASARGRIAVPVSSISRLFGGPLRLRIRAMSRHRSNQAAILVRLLSGRRGSSGCDRV